MTALLEGVQTGLWGAFLVFLRTGSALMVLPVFGERMVPVRVRLLISLGLTAIVAPAVLGTVRIPGASVGALALCLGTETVSGLAIGLSLRLFVLALQTAGSIAAQSTSLSQLFGGNVTDPLPAVGHILTVAGMALLVMTGLHVKAAAYFIFSYRMLPLASFPDGAMLSNWGQAHINQMFGLAFTLAAPFIILSILYNLTLGVINKAMPQLMVAFVGAPVITFGTIALLFFAAPVLLTVWVQAFDHFLTNPFGMP
ncbi:flagellar biosynthetic protein FliR [Puniceibacterium sp. IMCC21224]|uniref:flagellar biosynthetic protein FliR n=1 Tax=Puniceibacterium sp. IMCC21224 TaxID=1618204 RepID=UPI00064DFD70|nr:flagellar biosynthetic protein FliR [Puniceibacterium sp. IMCC21224]KMK65548.1 flagellar biosynthesis pathway, component FliR [Puniceibacterium sp. IMCC21224]